MLSEPLAQRQVTSACQLHERLNQWKRSDDALLQLQEKMPEFDAEKCLLKSVAVNALYSTRVMAITRMADHVCRHLSDGQHLQRSQDLVDRIAALPPNVGEIPRRFVSFAAKFCHFFVDHEYFPIYDEAARDALKHHLGKAAIISDPVSRYRSFCQNLCNLRSEAGINGTGRELDRYLWITGMYIKWLRNKEDPTQTMNVELRDLFEKPAPEDARMLDALLPPSLERPFKT